MQVRAVSCRALATVGQHAAVLVHPYQSKCEGVERRPRRGGFQTRPSPLDFYHPRLFDDPTRGLVFGCLLWKLAHEEPDVAAVLRRFNLL